VAAAVLLIRQAAQQAGPLLVAFAFDLAVPALRAHNAGPLVVVAVGYLVCAAISGAASTGSSSPRPASARTYWPTSGTGGADAPGTVR
jgi:hypothetical protein